MIGFLFCDLLQTVHQFFRIFQGNLSIAVFDDALITEFFYNTRNSDSVHGKTHCNILVGIWDLSFSMICGNKQKIHDAIGGTVKSNRFEKVCQMIVFFNEILQ